MSIIIGNRAAATALGCSAQTVARLLQNGTFPPPAQEKILRGRILRIWTTDAIVAFRAKLRRVGRPKSESKVPKLSTTLDNLAIENIETQKVYSVSVIDSGV
jgi:hypothetical protein